MTLIDGKAISEQVKQEIAAEVAEIVARGGKRPHLAAILVGHDGGSETYVAAKVKACEVCGFKSSLIRYESDVTEEELLAKVRELNEDDDVDGFIVQLPLPKHISEQKVIETIDYRKDVDGFHPINVGRMSIGLPCYVSATPNGILELLKRYQIETSGKKCVVLGRSNIVGKPMAALLGAFKAQLELSCGSIGGKDSMSGTFENIDVPPTLVSFAVSTAKADKVVSTEFKQAGDKVVMLRPETDENGIPSFESVRATFDKVEAMIAAGRIRAGWVIDYGGVAEGIAKMCFGNGIGFTFDRQLTDAELFQPCCGGFLLELCGDAEDGEDVIGSTSEKPEIVCPKFTLQLDKLLSVWEKKLEPVFPCRIKTTTEVPEKLSYPRKTTLSASVKSAQPRVLIPVFPGTNCEYDTARVFERAGARPQTFIVRNLSAAAMEDSITTFAAMVRQAQIIMIPGGFSGGDEPEGSGKFITAFFRNPRIKDAVHDLLKNRDGLMLGICNGFQALVKLGLVPFGEIMDMTDVSPTLTFNTIARHQSMLVRTRIASNKSPWLYGTEVDDVHTVAISHGEGRFVAPPELLTDMAKNGQIATQYVDMDGNPTMDIHFNPNTSMMAIEGITSPDGRVLGKMGHSERIGQNLYQNVPGEKDQKIFESGVAYFK